MISVIHKKQGFLKTLKYVLDKDKAEIISTGMAGTSAAILNKQFLAVASLNQSVVRKCAHIIVSIAAHERLSNSQYYQVTRELLKDLGYLPTQELSSSTSQFIAVRHHDRDHEHIHIVTSRVQHNGKSVSDSFDYFKAEVSTRRISAQLGLEIAPVSNNAVASRLKQEFGITVEVSPEGQKSLKQVFNPHKTPTSKQIIRQAIAKAIVDSPTIPTFIERLEASNIAVLPKTKENHLLGLTYIHKDVKIAGYQVYKPYSWTKLQSEYGLTYDTQKDSEFLERVRVKAIKTLSNYSNSTEPIPDIVFASKQCQELELSVPPSIPAEAKSEEEKVEALSPQIFNQSATEAMPKAWLRPRINSTLKSSNSH